MRSDRFQAITSRYPDLHIAVVGDFCLDRYLEIDPARAEVSIETGLPVHNVVNVRAQPGAAGTILNNLVALGVGHIYPVGFAGDDGEGFELRRALGQLTGVHLDGFVQTALRRTFTYCKPLVIHPGQPPQELNRLDSKNWSATPAELTSELASRLDTLVPQLDAIILLDQVDVADTGVVSRAMLESVDRIQRANPELIILADSRRGLRDFPPVTLKMNAAELGALVGSGTAGSTDSAGAMARELAHRNQRRVFVTLSERGMLGAEPNGRTEHVPVLPLRGPIDIVGAGDAVSANLTAALAGGADLREALDVANTAASVVIHKLGTTGTASVMEVQSLLGPG